MSNIINYNINLISIYNFNKIIFNLGKKSHFILKVFRNPWFNHDIKNSINKNLLILEVLFNATKIDIKIAIELIFEIKVISVNTLIKKGKVRKFKKIFGKKKKIKKAYIKFSLFDKNKLN